MIPYFIMILIPLIIYLFGKFNKKNYSKISIVSFFLILIFLLFLRNESVGGDVKTYLYIYNQISKLPFNSLLNYSNKGETLYYFLNKMIYLLHGNFRILLIIVALLSLIPIMLFYRKEIKNPMLTISLFITLAPFSIFFSGLRQSIAMGIVIFAFKYIKEKKLFKYIITIIIAYFFHRSAIFCLILYPLYYVKITNKWFYIVLPLIAFCYIFKSTIFSYVMNFVSKYFYEIYSSIDNNGAFMVLAALLLLCIYSYIFVDKNKQNMEFIGLRNFLLLATFIQCFAGLNSHIMRLNYYVLLFIPIFIPKVKEVCNDKNIKLINLLEFIIVFILVFKFIYGGYNDSDILQVFPYIPFWR